MGRKSERLAAMHAETPNCYWCGRKTRLLGRALVPGKRPWLDMATIDHLYDKFDVRRYEPGRNLVIACWKCNNERGQKRCEDNIEVHKIKSEHGIRGPIEFLGAVPRRPARDQT